MNLTLNTIHLTDAVEGLRQLPDNSINCVVTSPPYYGLRDYGIDGQIGLESTPSEFIARLMELFTEVWRVLKSDGTVWVNLGDSYASGPKNRAPEHCGRKARLASAVQKNKVCGGFKAKDLIGIPWRFAIAMQDAGWYIRQDIIWSKPNPMPESVTDRCTRAHEYIFMFTKSAKYWYDAASIRTAPAESSLARMAQDIDSQAGSYRGNRGVKTMKAVGRTDKQRGHSRRHAGFNDRWDAMTLEEQRMGGANRRSVWEIATKPFKEAHFATFPPELPWLCIRAGCPPDGIVLDPFMGAGTTALVARGLGRDFIGFEINPKYKRIADTRLYDELGFVAKGSNP